MSDTEEHCSEDFYYPNDPNFDIESAELILDPFVEEPLEISNSQEKINEFLNQQKAKNTVRKTRSDINIFQRYLQSIDVNEEKIECLPPEKLNHLLCKFFMEVTKSDGNNYEPNTISSYQRSIQRFLEEKNYKWNILKDKEFTTSRDVLAARRKALVHGGKGNKPNATKALTEEDEDALFSTGEFGDSSPEVLQRTVWWLLCLHFGFRARDESRKLRWGDVQLQSGIHGEMLVWISERGTKTRNGQECGHQRAFQPKCYATGGTRCPIEYYKKYRSHRPEAMCQDDSPFFLAINHKRSSINSPWYKKSPLGKNEIGKFLSSAAKKAGLQQSIGGKISNHSGRKTSISRLLDANIHENFVAQLSGHKSTESLKSYKTAGEAHQREMSLTLSRANNKDIVPYATIQRQPGDQRLSNTSTTKQVASYTASTASTDISALFSNVNEVKGCSFHVYNGPVTIQNQAKRRRFVIESDEEE